MRLTQGFRGLLVALVSFGLTVPQVAAHAANAPLPSAAMRVIDAGSVALGPAGELRGGLVDASGQGIAGAEVALVKGFQVVAETRTDIEGRFQINALTSGDYLLMTTAGVYRYQLVAADAAPADAKHGALVVVDRQLVRGSLRDSGLLGPGGLGGAGTWCVIGAAVAVGTVIAVAEDDDAS